MGSLAQADLGDRHSFWKNAGPRKSIAVSTRHWKTPTPSSSSEEEEEDEDEDEQRRTLLPNDRSALKSTPFDGSIPSLEPRNYSMSQTYVHVIEQHEPKHSARHTSKDKYSITYSLDTSFKEDKPFTLNTAVVGMLESSYF